MASTMKNGAKVLPELGVTESLTSVADGLYTAQIAQDATYCKVVTVTSSNALFTRDVLSTLGYEVSVVSQSLSIS